MRSTTAWGVGTYGTLASAARAQASGTQSSVMLKHTPRNIDRARDEPDATRCIDRRIEFEQAIIAAPQTTIASRTVDARSCLSRAPAHRTGRVELHRPLHRIADDFTCESTPCAALDYRERDVSALERHIGKLRVSSGHAHACTNALKILLQVHLVTLPAFDL